jgi:haloacetate dehalogenase
VIWHKVAPLLASKLTLVIPDLPGYGAGKGPAPDPANQNYSKCNIARLLAALMSRLGHEKFAVAGHDRGGRVGFRLALDYPDRILAFAPLDIVPTLYAWENMDWVRALDDYHWLFLAPPAPVPECLIGYDPDFYINHLLDRWAGNRDALTPMPSPNTCGIFGSHPRSRQPARIIVQAPAPMSWTITQIAVPVNAFSVRCW